MTEKGKTEKMSVTLPRDLVREIRSTASKGNVSAFFTEAIEHYLAYHRQRIALERGFGAWKDENHPDLKTTDDSVRYVNSIREPDRERLKRLERSDAD